MGSNINIHHDLIELHQGGERHTYFKCVSDLGVIDFIYYVTSTPIVHGPEIIY